MTEPAQPLDLRPIQARSVAHAAHQESMGWSCCTSHHSAADVPALLAEIRRLRELLDDRTGDIADKALENAVLRARLDDVTALCDQAERQATRWQDPLPVPGWVDDIRAVING